MGVSLERVQNKFACIIGELCNEPVVLSKFAIWLDLRLAEYKAKGAISLDGFGENPDPSWLKGHEKDDFNTMKASPLSQNETVPSWNLSTVNFPFAGGGQFPETEPLLNESITYRKIENVSVKEEVVENDIEIITERSEKSARLQSSEQNYKRLASDTNSGASGEKKFKRLSGDTCSRSPTSQDPTNESLVSIIAKSNNEINTVEEPVHVIPVLNSVTTNFNVHASDLVDTASKGDNSRALSHFDPFTIGSYTSASSTATITETSATSQPFQPFSPSGSEVVIAQDQSEILVNMTGNPTCPICHKNFVNMGSLRRHTQVHFPNSKRFACTYCIMRFRRLEHLRSHMRSQHSHLVKALPWDKRRFKSNLPVHRLPLLTGNSKQLSLPAPGSNWKQLPLPIPSPDLIPKPTSVSNNSIVEVWNEGEKATNTASQPVSTPDDTGQLQTDLDELD